MNSDLCIGIAAQNDTLELAARESGRTMIVMKFPATLMGEQAIKIFLASYEIPVRLAVAGVAALSLALSLGNVPGRQTFIVSPDFADQAVALALYAERTA